MLAVGFPLVLDVRGFFEKNEDNIFSTRKIMNKKITL